MRTAAFARQVRRSVSVVVAGVLILSGCSDATPTSTTAGTTSIAAPTTVVVNAPTSTTQVPTTSTSTTVPETTVPETLAPQTTAPREIAERSLTVPVGSAPTIDGIVEPGEWAEAATVAMSNDDTLHWMQDDHTLYMALEGTELGAVNLVIATDDELWILHSSAALGSSRLV